MRRFTTLVLAAAVLICTQTSAEAQGEIYMPNTGDRTVSVLDATTLLPLAPPIPILPTPGPGCLPEFTEVMEEVIDPGTGLSVLQPVLDPETGLPVLDPGTGLPMLEPVLQPVLDSEGQPVLSPIPGTAGFPDGVALSADRAYAFVAIDNCDQVAVIKTSTVTTATPEVTYIYTVHGEQETQIFLAPPRTDGLRFMYVTNCVLPHIGVIDVTDPSAASQVAVIDLDPDGVGHGGGYDMAFSADGMTGYFGNWSVDPFGCKRPAGVWRVDLTTNTLMAFPPYATDVHIDAPAISADGVAILATETEGSRIVVINLATAVVGDVMCSAGTVACSYNSLGAGIEIYGDRAYAVDQGANQLITIDVTDPLVPLEMFRTPIVGAPPPVPPFLGAWELIVAPASNPADGVRLFVTTRDEPAKVVAFDISNPSLQPVQLPEIGEAGFGGGELDGWWEAAVPTPPPTRTHARVKGEGKIDGTNGYIKFSLHARTYKNAFKGKCEVAEHTRRRTEKIHCLDVTSLVVNGNTATIMGNARHGRTLTKYTITVTDNGKPGRGRDLFSISTLSGFTAGGILTQGDIVINKHKGHHHHDDDDDDDDD